MNKKTKNKVFFTSVISLIIISLLIPFTSATDNAEDSFFYVDEQEPSSENIIEIEKTAGSTLEMLINLDNISYDSFKFTLNNLEDTSDVDTSDLQGEDVDIENEDSSIVITGYKEDLSISEIILYYQISDSLTVGETLTFEATIEENVENSENEIETITVIVTIVEETDSEEESTDSSETLDEEESSDLQENSETTTSQSMNNQNQSGSDSSDMQSSSTQTMEQSTTTLQTSSSIQTSSSTSGDTIESETVTYNGSSNNYLESLEIDGYSLTFSFAKETTTYFVDIDDDDVDSLDITATAEDDEATVCIYGNDDIGEGSKILISVTAENGNVRTYRIYVI